MLYAFPSSDVVKMCVGPEHRLSTVHTMVTKGSVGMKQQNGWQTDAASAQEKVAEVLRLNDEQLQAALRAVAQASGLNERRTNALTRDPEVIRRKLSSIRAEDLQKMLAQISPEQMAALTEQMQHLKNKEQ